MEVSFTLKRTEIPEKPPREQRSVFGKRCRFCHGPILFVWHLADKRHVAITPASWCGSLLYVKGVHELHPQHCSRQIRIMKTPKETDLIVEKV